jgi:hypothetical protein
MEEATAAWSRIHHLVEEAVNDQRCSLPIGQPEGMVAFADATSPNLTRPWREFTTRELYPCGSAGTAGVWTLMTVDAQVDSWHVCFMLHAPLGQSRYQCHQCDRKAGDGRLSRGKRHRRPAVVRARGAGVLDRAGAGPQAGIARSGAVPFL